MYTNYRKLTKKERDSFLFSIEEVLKECKVNAELEINYEVRTWDEKIPFQAPVNLLTKCMNPKNFWFTITISGEGKRK